MYLKRCGVLIVKPRVNVIVLGREAPMVDGSETFFTKIGRELAGVIWKTDLDN
jgi:hypothetical protein